MYLQNRVDMWQGLSFSGVYQQEIYIKNNPHLGLERMDAQQCFAHYLCEGMSAGLIASNRFNPVAYARNYPKLAALPGSDYKKYVLHYLKEGASQGLSGCYDIHNNVCYRHVFELNFYKEMNPDVVAVYGDDDEKYIRHFFDYGMSEGRAAIDVFDVHAYRYRWQQSRREELPDIKAYYLYYVDHIQSEPIDGRPSVYGNIDFAPVYSFAYYKAFNSDIRALLGDNPSAYIHHFCEFGMEEGRDANGRFSVWKYKNAHPELVERFGTYLPDYYMHYLKA